MEIPFFYAPGITESSISFSLDESSASHCIRVLRKRPGDAVILTDGKGKLFEAAIERADKKQCNVIISAMKKIPELSPKTGIGISFTKNISRIEWFLEKATEIGITDIYPLQCQRTERTRYNISRLQNLLIAAMLQSRQAYLPVLHDQIPLQQLVNRNEYTQRFMAHCEAEEKTFLLRALLKGADALILIGPEGDFTPEEIVLARGQHFIPVSLGQTRLRTETAGVVACTLMNALNE